MVPPTVCDTKADGAGPLLALSGHAQCADECSLLGAKRTLTNRCLPISISPICCISCCPTFISTAGQRATSSGIAVLNWVNGISSELHKVAVPRFEQKFAPLTGDRPTPIVPKGGECPDYGDYPYLLESDPVGGCRGSWE